MGTTKSGRYINTRGSARRASDYSIIHSNEGTFKWSQIVVDGKRLNKIILKSGGHGQKGLELLDKYGIEYHIEKILPNGVRIGYITDHDSKFKRQSGGQTWFPESWSEKTIRMAGEHVAGLKSNRHAKDGETIFGTWKGVCVGVKKTNGKIASIFPSYNQPNRKRGKKK